MDPVVLFNRAADELRKVVERSTQSSPSGHSFVLTHNVTEFLHLTSYDTFKVLWSSSFSGAGSPPPPLTSKHTVIMCILFQIKALFLLPLFIYSGMADEVLPASEEQLWDLLHDKTHSFSEEPAQCFNRFIQEQRRWMAFTFDFDIYRSLSQHDVVPLYTIHRITQPHNPLYHSSSKKPLIWKVVVPEQFVSERIQNGLPYSKTFIYPINGHQEPVFAFALKQYPSNNFNQFEQESQILDIIKNTEGFVQYIGRFDIPYSLVDGKPSKTFNILLELGQHDLETVFQSHNPPSSPKESLALWSSMVPVIKALVGFHRIEKNGISYLGWHGDVKPENIISVHGIFKLADPGEAIMLPVSETLSTSPPTAMLQGWSFTYGCPELNDLQSIPSPVTQGCDIWSLGCVFSLLATFIILGPSGISDYSNLRIKAVKSRTNFSADIFHDGIQVLPEVTAWHDELRRQLPSEDIWTREVLSLIDRYMLIPAKDRESASKIAMLFEEIVKAPVVRS
ncbi:kinase-like domain-containing protein [Podospora fimiseda]|uniref:Kinase-like domain-containing protein n=1 Tax=Podospora fimiseda TaxID=252190 RepID=A0AAN7BED9_9PEZI|nr:kinase-like domain-containing protein [Podospora fimiseda]